MTLVLYLVIAAAALVFVVASVARAIWYARHPMHLRWELYPVPHESSARAAYGGSYFETSEWWRKPGHVNRLGEWVFMAREIVFLHALHAFNRPLWYRSFPFHFGLYLLVAAVAGIMADSAHRRLHGRRGEWRVRDAAARELCGARLVRPGARHRRRRRPARVPAHEPGPPHRHDTRRPVQPRLLHHGARPPDGRSPGQPSRDRRACAPSRLDC